MESKSSKFKVYILLLLIFILADVICDNSIFHTFNSLAPIQQFSFFLGLLLLQTLAAPIQAGFSDFYGRKNSILISLSASLIAMILQYVYSQETIFYIPLLILAVISKGLLGNTIPLSWAAIADTKEKNVRFSFALSTGAFAAAYLLLIFSNKLLSKSESSILTIILFFVALVLCVFLFKDIGNLKSDLVTRKKLTESASDKFKKIKLILEDIKLILKDLKIFHVRQALFAFLLWEISLYSILLLYVDFDLSQFSPIALGMVSGYLFGVVLLKFLNKVPDSLIIKFGYNLSAISLIPFFVLLPFEQNPNFILLSVCYFLHMMGNAFLSATLFSILASEREPHEQGRIYGLISSIDTVAFLLSSISVIVYNTFKLNIIYIIAFSFLTVAFSWFPYAKFDKSRPGSRRNA